MKKILIFEPKTIKNDIYEQPKATSNVNKVNELIGKEKRRKKKCQIITNSKTVA